jgi:hypothetical protein
MLINLIPKLICGLLRGASGVGVVDRSTVEEEIWSELGALPRSRRHGYVGKADEGELEHNHQTEGRQGKPQPSLLQPPVVAE